MLKRLLKSLISNPGYKIASLLFAVLLWSYVIAIENPATDKIITDVPVNFVGESELTSNGLVVRGDRNEILKNITVPVTVDRNNYLNATKNSITATVNLRNVRTAGEFDLAIQLSSNLSTMKVNPSTQETIHVEIDELMRKDAIPVVVEFSGAKREDYYFSEASTTPSDISLSGPRKDIERVSKAVVTLDASQLKSYNDAMAVVLVDENGEEVTGVALSAIPSVIVKMDVLPKRSVPVNRENLLLGEDKIAEGYRLNLANLKIMPETVEVAAVSEVLDKIESIDAAPIDVQGWSASSVMSTMLRAPEGVILLQNEVDVYIDISEIPDWITFDDLPVAIEGKAPEYDVEITPQKVSVTITASANSMLSRISRGSIEPYIDITGFEPGQYELMMQYHITEKDILPTNAIIAPTPATINVLITEK